MGHLDAKRRKNIGFFIHSIEGEYPLMLCKGLMDAAEENDVNLIVFVGGFFKSGIVDGYQFNVAYEYFNEKSLDALILASGTLFNNSSIEEVNEFISKFKAVPIVSISLPCQGIPSVTVNNQGLKDVLVHLIKVHNKKKIAFVMGPENNIDAQERLYVFLQVIKENNIDLDQKLLVPGDFTYNSGVVAVQYLIDNKLEIDSIVCSNDEMAIGVIDTLKSKGIAVPDKILVVGFDNIVGAKLLNPSLTTIGQPIDELSRKSLEMALMLINGEIPESQILNTVMIIRESCGCLPEEFSIFDSTDKELSSSKWVFKERKYLMNIIDKEYISQMSSGCINVDKFEMFARTFLKYIDDNELDYKAQEKFINMFKEVINPKYIKENDSIIIQKLVTIVKRFLLVNTSDEKMKVILEDFFQMLRITAVDFVIKEQEDQWMFNHLNIRNLRYILEIMVTNINERDNQLNAIVNGMSNLGIKSCFVFLFEKEVLHRQCDIWNPKEKMKLELAFVDGEIVKIKESSKAKKFKEVLNTKFFKDNRRYTMILKPLFFKEEQLGLILCDFNMNDNFMFESLVVEMSSALKLSFLIRSRKQIENKLRNALNELERYNQALNRISQTDELTGLYNRRGFINLAKTSLKFAKSMGKGGTLFYFDMDGLKDINDNYGHDEGDEAIICMGRLLKQAFRNDDIIARLGGDEFTVFTTGLSDDFIPIIRERLDNLIEQYNSKENKPYDISVSGGSFSFSQYDVFSIEELMNHADKLLYIQKKEKKEAKMRKGNLEG